MGHLFIFVSYMFLPLVDFCIDSIIVSFKFVWTFGKLEVLALCQVL